jgi:hypothetical protein
MSSTNASGAKINRFPGFWISGFLEIRNQWTPCRAALGREADACGLLPELLDVTEAYAGNAAGTRAAVAKLLAVLLPGECGCCHPLVRRTTRWHPSSPPRVWTHARPVDDGGDEADAGEEVAGGLVVAGGDAAEVLDTAEGPLDDVAQPVALGVVRDRKLAR